MPHSDIAGPDRARATPSHMSRRRFLQAGAASLALSAFHADAMEMAAGQPKRVVLIGAGWYGKSDLWRLMQIAPVEVVSICDADQRMLAEAVEIHGQRRKSAKKPRTYVDYREMLKEKDLDIVLIGTPDHWHALQMIAAVEAGAELLPAVGAGRVARIDRFDRDQRAETRCSIGPLLAVADEVDVIDLPISIPILAVRHPILEIHSLTSPLRDVIFVNLALFRPAKLPVRLA